MKLEDFLKQLKTKNWEHVEIVQCSYHTHELGRIVAIDHLLNLIEKAKEYDELKNIELKT